MGAPGSPASGRGHDCSVTGPDGQTTTLGAAERDLKAIDVTPPESQLAKLAHKMAARRQATRGNNRTRFPALAWVGP
jgi:hypothetical protein